MGRGWCKQPLLVSAIRTVFPNNGMLEFRHHIAYIDLAQEHKDHNHHECNTDYNT